MNVLPHFRDVAVTIILAANLSACMEAAQTSPGGSDSTRLSRAERAATEEYWRDFDRDQARLDRGEDVCGIRYTGLRPGVPLKFDPSEKELLRQSIPLKGVTILFEAQKTGPAPRGPVVLLERLRHPRLMTVEYNAEGIVTAVYCGNKR